MAGVFGSFVEGPSDLVKSKMQVQYEKSAGVKATFQAAFDIIRKFGIRGIYQGLGATMLRNIPANAAYFAFYETFRRMFSGDDKNTKLSPVAALCAGGIGGLAYWTFSFPLDVNKSIMQVQPSDVKLRKYANSLDAMKSLWKAEGFAGFWRGFTPCLIRAFPANAVCFFSFEFCRKFLE